MSELEDSFTQLLGRQPTDKDKQDLYRARDALKLKATDSVWLLLMALQHYLTLYEQIPARIAAAAREITRAVRKAAEAEAKAATEEAKKAMMEAVRQVAARSASKTAGQRAQWVGISAGLIGISLLMMGWAAFNRGYRTGRAIGTEEASKGCRTLAELSSWATTSEGQLAYALSKAGGLSDAARCSGRGMVPREGSCTVPSERGKVLARWPLPSLGASNVGGRP